MENKSITVHTLCGKSDIEMAKESILSLQKFSSHPIHHKIFSDGTICDQEDYLRNSGIKCSIVSKEEADDRVAPIIANTPKIQKMRRENPRTRKTFDIPLLSEDVIICMADTDVFGVRPYHNLFESSRTLAFNKEHRIGTSGTWRDIIKSRRKFPLALKLNSGLYQVSKRIYDLDFFEFTLKNSAFFPGTGYLHEQTLWSAFAAQNISKLELFTPEQIAVVTDKTNLRDQRLCVAHFIRPSRYRIKETEHMIKRTTAKQKYERIGIRTQRGKIISITDVAWDRIAKAARKKSKAT